MILLMNLASVEKMMMLVVVVILIILSVLDFLTALLNLGSNLLQDLNIMLILLMKTVMVVVQRQLVLEMTRVFYRHHCQHLVC
jgi:hypothetical protein